ncbi:hypothetical protein AUJ59_02390 [Candidatus Beckwithbacteria bacterium CG1_02_47_37]|uniref:Glycoside hydrolase family 5 domain-containing protein n=1 Tax=Candidatus Beckwithbacteria bacterium CG1_02_47_37 TaxID=1805034 RepID=A0A1J4RTC6_9BACT|nr:MAG: hypothetical protein AUJ59_02390 [Candidatus Beckwithbacteria bacterium CG1_02_47_37]
MKPLVFFGIFLLWLLLAVPVQAIVDPRLVPNNRFGIHILEAEDLAPAAGLVNTNGDWGYVTLVIRFNDLNRAKWQAVFDEMRRRHLIPLVRLATVPENSHWVNPNSEDVDRWVEFLNSLNWVVQNRYVILFNEPNHAKEWGNEIKPHEYAAIVKEFQTRLKAASADFFILPAGLDTAAPNSKETMAATEYWRQMALAVPEIFTLFDGWNSHSYPNPAFSGPIIGSGLGSIRSYQAEINYLSRFGLPGHLPVFITETGWVNTVPGLSELYTEAYTQVWQQPNLVAVTPFVLNYPALPFKQFSWLGLPHYGAVANLPKTSGRPEQIQNSELIDQNLPDNVVAASDYHFWLELINTGQSIWERENFSLRVIGNLSGEDWFAGHVNTTEPGQAARIDFNFKTPANAGLIDLKLQLALGSQPFGALIEKKITVVPPPTVVISARRWYKVPADDDQYRLLLYDAENRLLQEINQFDFGRFEPVKLYNVVPGNNYRLVIVKPYYLPRQTWMELAKGENQVKFKPLLPVDFNNDGRLSLTDLGAWLLQPVNYLRFGLQPGD